MGASFYPPNTPSSLQMLFYSLPAADVILLTPSGRFQTSMKICFISDSADDDSSLPGTFFTKVLSGYHSQNWHPAWGIRTVLISLIAFFASKPQGGIGSLDYTSREKRI
eukprot:g27316.t1